MKTDWAAAFVQFFYDHPDVWKLYQKYANEAYWAPGNKNHKFSTKLLNERIRWDAMVGGWDYQTTNSMTAYYGRLLMWKYPRYRDSMNLKRIPIDGDTKDLYDIETWDQEYWSQFNDV